MFVKYEFSFSGPIVCTAIHNGHQLSDKVKDNINLTKIQRLREEDPYTEFFTGFSENRVSVYTSRFEVDLNRRREKCFYLKPEDAWGLEVRKKRNEKIREQSLEYYDFFYQAIRMFFDEMTKIHGFFFIFDIHSYNHQRSGRNSDYDSPEENPEIIIGTSNMNEKWFPLVEKIRERMLDFKYYGRKLDVRVNVKFPGGFFPRWIHNNYSNACCVSIEFKKIFMNEWTGELYQDKFDKLQRLLPSVQSEILKFT